MNENEYCLISKELLLLLKWICENEPEMIDKIVSKSFKKGFKYNFNEFLNEDLNQVDLQEAVFDFFSIMELSMKKNNEDNVKKIINIISDNSDNKNSETITNLKFQEEDVKNLVFALNKIEEKNFNEKINDKNINLNKDLFFQEFLNNWEPKNKVLN